MRKVNCPLMKEIIEDGVCFDISMVAEGLAPEYTAPKKIQNYENYKDICLSCKNHRYD